MFKALSFLLAALLLASLPARAEDTVAEPGAPSMADVNEIIVQFPRFTDETAAVACGLGREDIVKSLVTALTQLRLPAIGVMDAKPPLLASMRLNLVPEISVLHDDASCISWASLFAEGKYIVRLPPSNLRRSAMVAFWRGGLYIKSAQSLHGKTLIATLERLAKQFATQYSLDQPAGVIPQKTQKDIEQEQKAQDILNMIKPSVTRSGQ